MSQLILVRHGQASFGKANYDQLSAQGQQQAVWLGEHFESIALNADLVISGSLERHKQTKNGILERWSTEADHQIMPNWNEFDFEKVIAGFLTQHPEERPLKNEPREFFRLLKNALKAWSKNEINAPLPETWQQFQDRVADALDASLDTKHKRIVVVSSGGTISVALGLVMGLTPEQVINLNLQTRNTGVSEVFFNKQARYLSGFNAVPHLLHKDRKHAITSA